MENKEVKGAWLVISRDFGMSGGLFDLGVANMDDFFENEKDAIVFAEKLLFQHISEGRYDPHVWVLRCERTYIKNNGEGGYCYSKYKKETKK